MDEQEFKPFPETYKKISFAMTVGMLYPNPKKDKYRLAAIALMIGSAAPFPLLLMINTYRCWREDDFVNVVRHSIVLGPFFGVFIKTVLMYMKRVSLKQLLDEITCDYLMLNNLSQNYKDMGKTSIKNSQTYSETCWMLVVTFSVVSYPAMAAGFTTYSYLFQEEPVRYMVHELTFPNVDPEETYESPLYELFYAYTCYCIMLYEFNFVGFDGFFGVALNHACLKMECYCEALEEAMRSDSKEIYKKVVGVVKEQCQLFEYINRIHETFSIWLSAIFVVTLIQICTSLYHITEVRGNNVMYVIFLGGAVAHIYVPCRYAAKVKQMSLDTADKIYGCGWESVRSQSVRKLIVTMISRAQVPIQITAFNMINFDMEMFAWIMQTSYSMFTLLKS